MSIFLTVKLKMKKELPMNEMRRNDDSQRINACTKKIQTGFYGRKFKL